MPCWYIGIGPEKGTLGESGSAWFVIGSPVKGEFSIYIEYLSDRQVQWAAFGAATGSLIAGLHRHISVLASFRARLSVRIYVTRLFVFPQKQKPPGVLLTVFRIRQRR